MINNPKVAQELDVQLDKIFVMLRDSISYVRENASPSEAARYREQVSKLLYTMMFDIWEPLYSVHPELKPRGWDKNESDHLH